MRLAWSVLFEHGSAWAKSGIAACSWVIESFRLFHSNRRFVGGRLREHRFQPAKSRLDCLEVMVKDPTESGSLVAREAFSVGRDRSGPIRRISDPGDRNFRQRRRWKGFGQQKGQVQWSGDHPYIRTHRCGDEWRIVLSIFSVCWWSRKENHCSHQWTPWDNLPLTEIFRVTPTRLCSSIQQHFPRDVIFSTTVANLVR